MRRSAFRAGVSVSALLTGLLLTGQLAPVPAAAQSASPGTTLQPIVVSAPRESVRPKPVVRQPTAVRAAAARRLRAARAAPVQPAQEPAGATAGPRAAASPPTLSRWSPSTASGGPAFVQKWQLPSPSVASITRREIDDKVNVVDTQDAIKYFPSLWNRKRNDGDTQSVLATRTWGVNSSARTLVYADDLLLTALVGNDNTIGAPRWGLVAPEEIDRIDFLYGPFSAAYPGNSMGGVLQITTRMPEKLELTAKQTESIQTFNLWGTNKSYVTHTTSATMGDRIDNFSWFLSGNLASIRTQPLTYVTTAYNGLFFPGEIPALSKVGGWAGGVGGFANVLGSAGALDKTQVNGKLKLAYDFTPYVRATWQTAFWSNDASTQGESFIGAFGTPQVGAGTAAAGTYLGSAALQSFGSAYYRVQEQMLTNAGSLKSNTGGLFDFELSAANFTYLKSDQVSPFSAAPPFGYTQNGQIQRNGGTYWNLADAKGVWRPEFHGKHEISFGAHADEFHLNSPTYLTSNWTLGMPSAVIARTISQGTTKTQALWLQDAWKFHPAFKFTLGGRWENWSASGGYNQTLGGINALGTSWTQTLANMNASAPIFQPALHHTRFSPKASLQWTPDDLWTVTGSIGMANRFPTVRELYQIQTSAAAPPVSPNPNLRPEVALTEEISIQRKIGLDGNVRLSFFNEEVRDALMSHNTFSQQTWTPVTGVVDNVTRVRNRGVEIAFSKNNFLIDGFELQGSATFVDSRILADLTWSGGQLSSSDMWNGSPVGKNAIYVPKWRWTMVGTYRPNERWAFTVAARWQDRIWSTLSNNDIVHGVYQSFDRFFVVDAKVRYKLNDRAEFAFGVDNVGNCRYFLFHPFPQRTFSLSGKFQLGSKDFDDIGIFRTAQR